MKKRITKRSWYSDELENGKAKAPSVAPDDERHLEGINRGEIHINDNSEDTTIFVRDNKGKIVRFRPDGSGDLDGRFLRKDQPDRTPHLLSLLGGVHLGDFVPGIIGAIIDKFGDGEMGSLVLRKFLSVPELRFNRAIVYKGKQIISPGGGCLIESFTLNGNGTWTIAPKLEEGEPLSQEVDDILLAYWHDKDVQTGAFKGFREMKFRVTDVDYDAKTFVIVPKPNSLSVPAIAMTLAQVGNFTNTERQTYIMIDSTQGNNNITFFDDCNTWDIEEHQEKSWFGKKNGRKVAGVDASAYSAVLQNIIMSGLIFQIDEISGDSVRVPCDKNSYKPGDKCAYYDRVPYDGGLWLCVNEKGTSETPKEGHPDWLNVVKKGATGESIKMLGHWNSDMRPVPANCMVSYANGVYLSLRETSQAPVSTLLCADGSYFTNETGGYTLASYEVNEDWELILENGKNGVSILFQGSFSSAPDNPKDGWSYYNTTDCRSYVYQGEKWYVTSIDGKDGKGIEWIFTRTTTKDKPVAVESAQQDDYVPAGWTDDPQGCTPEYILEWACKRVKKDGVWQPYSSASIFNMYAFSTTSQWSTNNTDWHATFVSGDIYIRYSSDGGKTWTDGARAIGETGKGGPYTDFEFAVGKSNIQAPMSGWQDAPPDRKEGEYIWMRTQYIIPPATVNPSSWAYSCITGTDGIGILSSDVLYYLSTSPTSLVGGEWQTTSPTWSSGKYMWTKTKVVYTNNTTKETEPACITGSTGKGVQSIVEEYYLSSSATVLEEGSWVQTSPTWKQGYYVWTHSVITYTDNTSTTTSNICVSGGIGETGSAGVIPCGHWQSANIPYKKTSLVTIHNASFVALVDTAKPPVWLIKWGSGPTDYLINNTGGYTPVTDVENNRNTEWLMITPPPVNGSDGKPGDDSTSYWLTCPVSTFNINSVGSLSPSAVFISCKKKKGEGTVTACSDFYLAARKYNGSWLAHVSPVKASSISVNAVGGYTQFTVRAYNSESEANSWSSGFVSEIGIGVSKDGPIGDTGPAGSFPRDRDFFVDGESYVWNPSYRDSVLYPFDGVYYKFHVANFGATVTKAPTSAFGDGLWESMGKYRSIATDTLFADGANVALFMFKNGILRSQDEKNGVPNLELDGKTGKIRGVDVELSGKIEAKEDSQIAGMRVVGNSLRGVQAIMGKYMHQITGDSNESDKNIIVNNIDRQQVYIFSITKAAQDIGIYLPSAMDMIRKGIVEYQFELTIILDNRSLGSSVQIILKDGTKIVHVLKEYDRFGIASGSVLKLFYFQNKYYLISSTSP